MSDETHPVDQLHAALQTSACGDDELEGSVLVGWVTVAEWVGPDGMRWISRLTSENAATWQVNGYLDYARDSFGPVGCDEEDDE